jgi:serine/threonine-protein kinase
VATSRTAEQVGRVLGGRYRLLAPLGSGASAQVFLADDVELGRRVAVKVLHSSLADDDAFLRRFRAEARAAAALTHPHIMAVYDWDDREGPYVVLEHLAGGSLRALLDTGARLSLAQALLIGVEAARGLDHAHRRGFVHRDVKPANLLFDDEGRLRIADFGLARALSEAAWTEPEGTLVGTARYASPEQARGERVDGRSDVYSLALVVIEAVTGSVPFAADTQIATLMARLDGPLPVPEALGPLVPALEAAGAVDPAERCDAAGFGRLLLGAARRLDRPEPLPLAGSQIDLSDRRGPADITILPATVHRPDGPPETRPGPAVGGRRTRRSEVEVVRAPAVRRRRRWPWLLLVPLLLAGAAGGTLAWLSSRPPRFEVPSLVTLTREGALEVLATAEAAGEVDWEVDVEALHFDNVPAGQVVDQRPAADEELVDGGRVHLVVSLGPPPRTVPADLGGLVPDEAGARLQAAELALGAVTARHDEVVPEGQVITWVGAGAERPAELPKGTPVDLVVSDGPAPRAVPELTGVATATARARLDEVQLEGDVVEEFSTTVAKGVVIRSDPPAGRSIARGETVTLVVSKGRDLVTVPDVKGRSLPDATAALVAAGLRPNEVFGRATGVVDSTDPDVGASVDRGTLVDVFLK